MQTLREARTPPKQSHIACACRAHKETQIRGSQLPQTNSARAGVDSFCPVLCPACWNICSFQWHTGAPGPKESLKPIRKERDLEIQPCPQAHRQWLLSEADRFAVSPHAPVWPVCWIAICLFQGQAPVLWWLEKVNVNQQGREGHKAKK